MHKHAVSPAPRQSVLSLAAVVRSRVAAGNGEAARSALDGAVVAGNNRALLWGQVRKSSTALDRR
jgi:hypothetical protein